MCLFITPVFGEEIILSIENNKSLGIEIMIGIIEGGLVGITEWNNGLYC